MPRRDTYTASQLIEEIQSIIDSGTINEDTPVKFVYDYGDHWHTSVASDIVHVELGKTKYSDYHNMDQVDDDDFEDDEDEKQNGVVLLR